MNPDSDQSLPRVLLLSSAELDETRALNDELVSKLTPILNDKLSLQWANYHEVGLELDTGKIRAFLLSDNTDLNAFACIYFKSYFRNSEYAAAIAEYLSESNVPFLCSELKNYIALTKLTQLARLSRKSLPIPKTVFMLNDRYVEFYDRIVDSLGSPFIFKAIDGATGRDNYLINDEAHLRDIVDQNPQLLFIAQKFIPNQSDLRVLIVNKQIELVIKRQRKDDSTHLNNTSQGADAILMDKDELQPEYQEMSLAAAEAMNREVAGVDLMFDKDTNQPYILEVNASPQIASGAFIDEKLDVYSNLFLNMLK